MTEKNIAGIKVEVDEEGYLVDFAQWTKELAIEIAKEEGIPELTEKHWQVIEFLQKDTLERGESPAIRRITKRSGVTTKELFKLFPDGPGKKAAKIAGVLKPASCV